MKKVKVELKGGPFDGEKVWVEEKDDVQYIRQIPSDYGNDHAAIYSGDAKQGWLNFVDDQEIIYEKSV